MNEIYEYHNIKEDLIEEWNWGHEFFLGGRRAYYRMGFVDKIAAIAKFPFIILGDVVDNIMLANRNSRKRDLGEALR